MIRRLLHLIFGHKWIRVQAFAPWEQTPLRQGTFDCPFVYQCKCGAERIKHIKWD